MLLLIDTCFWNHCKEIQEAHVWDFRDLLPRFRWGYTSAVLEEIKHYYLDNFVPVDNAMLVPASSNEIDSLKRFDPVISEFDLADQSLLVAGRRERGLVLTDDGPLELECMALDITTFRLPGFMLKLIQDDLLEKTIFNRCWRLWEKTGRYRKVDLKKWHAVVQEIT
ncbi:MAG: hypothetical protein GYA24_11475 [Candidatus Lokiarchaeota archaeon]|nr:hypothetical protein [Candidatus Lokiarchaeota archaeon]